MDGVRALAFGETGRVDGSSLGLPDRVARGYALIVGDDLVQVGSETTGPELGEVLRGLRIQPRWAALDGVLDVLPSGTVVAGQGVRSRWGDVDVLKPEQAVPPVATGYGADLVLPDTARRGIAVSVERGTRLVTRPSRACAP